MRMPPDRDPAADDPAPEQSLAEAFVPTRTQLGDLNVMLELIRKAHDARDPRRRLVDDIRAQVGEERYLCEEKVNLAIYRLLKDILD